MSLLKNKTPNLFYTVKTTEVINASLKPQQIVNHYAKASSFTTKVKAFDVFHIMFECYINFNNFIKDGLLVFYTF